MLDVPNNLNNFLQPALDENACSDHFLQVHAGVEYSQPFGLAIVVALLFLASQVLFSLRTG